MSSVRLFVYGSLKRDGRHHDQLCGARFLGQAVTVPGYALVSLGDYLALVPAGDAAGVRAGPGPRDPRARSGDGVAVPGELFEVDEALLPLLDEFEGPEYERAPVALKNDEIGGALAYLLKAR